MIVTKIEAVTTTRFKVYIDEKFAFVLYKGELSRYHVAVGEKIEKEIYDKIYKEVILKRAKLRALHLLNAMGRTESQLRQKLKQDHYPDEITEEAIAYVKSFGYINDDAYARNFIECRKERKSKKELYAQMIQKGLDKEVIDRAFEESYGREDAKEAITEILRKKKYDPETADRKETRKILGFLTRKGFGYDDIRQVIQVSEWNA
ncbi:MAG: regulatory protein RecX [Lachnospiraceae bacterium]